MRRVRFKLLMEDAYQETPTDTVTHPTDIRIRQESENHNEDEEKPIKEQSTPMEELGSGSQRSNKHRGPSWWRRVFHGRKRRISRKTRARLSLPNLNLADPWFRGSNSEDSSEEETVYERMEEDDEVDEEYEFEEGMEELVKNEKGKRKWWKGTALWKK